MKNTPLQCTLPGCEYIAKSNAGLNAHKQGHLGRLEAIEKDGKLVAGKYSICTTDHEKLLRFRELRAKGLIPEGKKRPRNKNAIVKIDPIPQTPLFVSSGHNIVQRLGEAAVFANVAVLLDEGTLPMEIVQVLSMIPKMRKVRA